MIKSITPFSAIFFTLHLLAAPSLATEKVVMRAPAREYVRQYSHHVLFFSDSLRLNFCAAEYGELNEDRNGGRMAQEYHQNAPRESQKKAKEYCDKQLKANSSDSAYSCTVGKTDSAEIRIGNEFFCKSVTYADEGGRSED